MTAHFKQVTSSSGFVTILIAGLLGTVLAISEPWAAETSPIESEESEATEKRVAKVVWDIKVRTTPEVFKAHLKDIREAYDALVREKIEPEMVFLFRGPSVRLLRRKQPAWSKTAIQQVTKMLADFQKLEGVRMEADPVALETAEKEARQLLPGIKPIKNGFVALIEYHTEGYATISLE